MISLFFGVESTIIDGGWDEPCYWSAFFLHGDDLSLQFSQCLLERILVFFGGILMESVPSSASDDNQVGKSSFPFISLCKLSIQILKCGELIRCKRCPHKVNVD